MPGSVVPLAMFVTHCWSICFLSFPDGKYQRWEAIVFVSPPVSLLKGDLLQPAELNGAEVSSPVSPVASEPATGCSSGASHWEEKYRVKYKVKHLVEQLMEGPMGCSTPRPEVHNRMSGGSLVAGNRLPWSINALVKKVLEDWDQHQSEKADGDEKKLVERFVYKYFFKLKMKGNF